MVSADDTPVIPPALPGPRPMEIGLALSGGGVRAAAFHLGVLQRLAADGLLEQLRFVSTVSGGSLVMALVYALNNWTCPGSPAYTDPVLPQAYRRLTSSNLQQTYIWRCVTRPWRLVSAGRAHVLASALRDCWGIDGLVRDLPSEPRWVINATTYETGKNWRFMPQRMGDYTMNHVLDPPIPIADAVAASSAFPGLVGPLVLKKSAYSWSAHRANQWEPSQPLHPEHDRIHLWDGGVYDNLGVEALYKPKGDRFRDEFNFVLISDASLALAFAPRRRFRRALRLINIATDQVRGLRSRMLVEHFRAHPGSGSYLAIGKSVDDIRRRAAMDGATLPDQLAHETLTSEAIAAVARMKPSLRRLTRAEADTLIRHGWEVADCTLGIYHPELFQARPWPGVTNRPPDGGRGSTSRE